MTHMAGSHKHTADKTCGYTRPLRPYASMHVKKMNSKPKILIIDDDVDLCESIEDIVELDDYLTDSSHTAADGLEKVESSFCNIVLLDMKLPDSDGLTVLEKIKQESPDTEVIIFTAYAQMDTVIAAMDKDAFSFLPKPFDMPYLLTTIKRALKKQQLIHENRILYQQTIEEEREWEETFDSISDLVSIHDKDLNIIRCNKAVIEKLNVDYSDIIGKKCHEVFHGRNEPWSTCPFLKCKQSLRPESEEEECLDGTFMMSCYPRLDEARQFNGVVHIARDITARKQEELAMNTLVVTAAENEGKKFFEQTVSSLYDWLDADCVILGQLIDENTEMALAMKMDGKLVKNYSYELQGSPCGDVTKKGFCHYPEGVIDLFPDDEDLVQWKVEGYVGISLKDKDGNCIGTICALSHHKLELPPGAENVFNIISARASVEIERITAEKRVSSLSSVLEDSLNEIYIFKADTLKFLQVNKGARMNLGYSMDTLRNLTPLHIKPKFTKESFEKELEPLRSEEKELIIFETVHQRRDGSLYDVEVHLQLTTFEKDPAFLAIVLDITKRKESEKALATSQEQYRSIIDDVMNSLNIGIFILDNEFKVVWINKAMEVFFGIKLAEIIGKNKKQIINERIQLIFKEPEEFRQKVFSTYENNTYVENFICHVLPGDGREERWLEHWSQPISSGLYEGGRVEHYTDISALEKFENELIKSEQKFRAIFDNTFQFIGLLKPDGTLIEINKGPLEFAGINRSDVINKPVWDAPWWSHSETLQELLKKSILRASQGDFVRFEATHRKKDGTLAYIDTSLTPVKNMDGDIIFIIKEGRDITELKLIEETVHKLSQAIQQSNVIVVITDLEGNIEYVNPRFCESTGYKYDEIIGKNPSILKSGETPDEEYRELWKTITSGNEWRGEFHNKKKSGELYWENASISPIRDIEGNIINFLGIKEDITDKKSAEQDLLKSEERYRSLIEATTSIIWTTDQSGGFVVPQLSWERFTGQPWNEHKDYGWTKKIHPDDVERLLEEWKKAIREISLYETFGRIWNADLKEWRNFEVRAVPIRIKKNHNLIQEWVGVITDITERKQAEQALIESEKKLITSYKMASLGRLTAGVFHELLNPVNIISSHIQLLLMEAEKGSKTEEDLNSIQDEIKRIVKISDSLLRFSRKGDVGTDKVDLNDLIERTISIVEPDMKLQNVKFNRKLDDKLSSVIANSDQLRQVFLNLITNARDAMPEGGVITINSENVSEGEVPFVRLQIADTGCGIEKSKMHMVFDPFFTTKREGKGTGLGLSTSYGIIEDHGGSMSAVSDLGKGTTFIIDLPVKI